MDLFDLIRTEHQEIVKAADRLIGSDPEDRVDAMGELIAKTLTHMSAEEHSIYPAIENLQDVYRSIGLRNEEEHFLARSVLNDLLYKGLDYEHWSAKLQVFRSLIQNHMESEENITFSVVADNFNQEEIAELTRRYNKTRAELVGDNAVISPLVRR